MLSQTVCLRPCGLDRFEDGKGLGMALLSDAAMVLFYDIEGNTADHDDWHSHEHFHERLSVPGFLRATRWVATAGAPRYMVIYEVSDTDVATSQGYLERLNTPTEWTQEIMPRFRGMTRGFCQIPASAGFGLGCHAHAVRFTPEEGAEAQLSDWIANEVLPDIATRRGLTSAHVFIPTAPPPMTKEQSLRGADMALPWLVVTTAYDAEALQRAASEHLAPDQFCTKGARADIATGQYALHHSATAAEAEATAKPPVLTPKQRQQDGSRR